MNAPGASIPSVRIVGNSRARLWGLDGATRLERQLRALGVADPRPADAAAAPAAATVLLLRGAHLFDDRVLKELVARPGLLLTTGVPGGPAATAVAAHVAADLAPLARSVLEDAAPADALAGVSVVTAASLSSAYLGRLLKAAPLAVLPIRAARVAALERYLFHGAYKGVTDLVTKWVWPAPAEAVTRACARAGLSPNVVTSMSYVLAIAVLPLFAHAHWAAGLLLAWIMTFLDTVDGKLARVTVTSTKAGHLFDHLLDLVHPPLWYLAWGWGLQAGGADSASLAPLYAAIVGGYVAGRLVEGGFDALVAGFPIFSWRPVDSYFRLVLARRNPNLLLLTAFAAAGRPREGLAAVAAWTVLSTVVLAVRLAQAAWQRSRRGTLRSWMEELGSDLGTGAGTVPRYARPFATDPSALRGLVD